MKFFSPGGIRTDDLRILQQASKPLDHGGFVVKNESHRAIM